MRKNEIKENLNKVSDGTSCILVVSDIYYFDEEITRLKENGYEVKILNLKNPEKSARYNPFAYLKSESDIIEFAGNFTESSTLDRDYIYMKSGNGCSSSNFWSEASRQYLTALISYIVNEGTDSEKNLDTLIEMIIASDSREDDDGYKNAVDLVFDDLEAAQKCEFAVRQYRKFILATSYTRKNIACHCGLFLAPYDFGDMLKLTERDELELDGICEKKTALFTILPNHRRYTALEKTLFSQISARVISETGVKKAEYYVEDGFIKYF